MQTLSRIQYSAYILLLLFWLITSDAFNSPMLRFMGGFYGMPLNTLVIVCLIFLYFYKRKNIIKTNCHFSKFILAFIGIPFISGVNSCLFQGQTIGDALLASFLNYTSLLLLYFVLHAYKVNERTILKAIISLGVFLTIVLIVQQIFPGAAYFGVLGPDGNMSGLDMEIRNNLYRFRMRGTDFVMLTAFYFWSLSLRKISLNKGVLFCLSFIGIYLFLTRQILFGSIMALFLSFFVYNGKVNKWSKYLMILLSILAIYYIGDTFLGDLLESSKETVDNDDYVRYLSYAQFWKESTASPWIFLFGNGLPAYGSQFANYLNNLQDFGLFLSDVGCVGQGYQVGYVFIAMYYVMIILLFLKYRKVVPLYILMYVFVMAICSVMLIPVGKMAIWAVILYICDLHINKSTLAIEVE